MTTEAIICNTCRIGRCQPVKAPYIYWVDDQVMVMPDSPALACDICGQVEFEPSFLIRIERLLQELESSMELRRSAKTSVQVEGTMNWQSSRNSR